MSKPTFSSALAMGLSSVACAFACGYLATRGAVHIAAIPLIACAAFAIAAVGEYVAAARRRRQRHAPFVRLRGEGES